MYGFGMFLATNGIVNSGSSYSTRTQAFATATGITDLTILNALNTFDLGLISNSLDTKMTALYPFVGGTSTTHSYNFMNTSLFQLTYYGGITHSSTGMVGNGTNGYVDTGIVPLSRFTLNDTMVGIYSRTNNTTSGVDFGAGYINTSNEALGLALRYSGTSSVTFSANSTWKTTSYYANTQGLFCVGQDYTTQNNISLYKNGSLTTSTTQTTCVLNPNPIFIMAYGTPSASDYSNREYSFFFTSKNLNSSELSTFYTLVQNLQTALSRQV